MQMIAIYFKSGAVAEPEMVASRGWDRWTGNLISFRMRCPPALCVDECGAQGGSKRRVAPLLREGGRFFFSTFLLQKVGGVVSTRYSPNDIMTCHDTS